jgi:hypothetical protein
MEMRTSQVSLIAADEMRTAVSAQDLTKLHGAEPFLRSRLSRNYSITSQHFMETEGSVPYSQDQSTVPILIQINPVHTVHPISLRFILILSSRLRSGLPNGLVPSGFFHQYPIRIPVFPRSCYMSCPSHSS